MDEEVFEERQGSYKTMQKRGFTKFVSFTERKESFLEAFWKGLVIVLAIWGFIDLSRRAIQPFWFKTTVAVKDELFYCKHDCGNSAAKAYEKGCIFDDLETRMTRPECVNAELNKEFVKTGRGPNGTYLYGMGKEGELRELTVPELVEVIEPGAVVWKSTWWHLVHCIFMYRKASLSRFDGVFLSMTREEQEHHDKHCGRILMRFLSRDPEVDEYTGSTFFGEKEKDE